MCGECIFPRLIREERAISLSKKNDDWRMLDSPAASAVSRAIDRAASGQLSTSESGADERASNKRKACTSLTVRKVRPGNRDANGKRRANACSFICPALRRAMGEPRIRLMNRLLLADSPPCEYGRGVSFTSKIVKEPARRWPRAIAGDLLEE